jgi:SAM-dependent methyltransferase
MTAPALGRAGSSSDRKRVDECVRRPVDTLISVKLTTARGDTLRLHMDRYMGGVTSEEGTILAHVIEPALDVGCGPGRHVLALAEKGLPVLGIDSSLEAVAIARDRGAPVLQRSVFGPVPGAGRWNSVLLLDGNLGIGGDPRRLLRRIAALLSPAGRLLTETEAPGIGLHRTSVRIETSTGASACFPWARVGAESLVGLARSTGFSIAASWSDNGRWFARLDRN